MSPHIDAVRADLLAAAELGDDDLKNAAARLGRALDASVRVRLQDVLGEAVHELNGQLESGRVELHLAGEDVALAFVGDEPGDANRRGSRRRSHRPNHAAAAREAQGSGRGGRRPRRHLHQRMAGACRRPEPRHALSACDPARASPDTPRANPPFLKGSTMTTHSTPTPPRLDLRIPAGMIEVELEARDTTTVELTAISGGDAAQAAIDATRQELRTTGGNARGDRALRPRSPASCGDSAASPSCGYA